MTPSPNPLRKALKPCPFCGAPAEYDSRRWHPTPSPLGTTGHAVYCSSMSCNAENGIHETEEDAIEAWNARSALAADDAAGGGTASEARAPDNRVIVRLTICGDSTGWQEKTCATSFAVLLPHSLDRFRQHRLIVGEAAKAISDYMADECLNALYPLPPAPAGADEKEDGR